MAKIDKTALTDWNNGDTVKEDGLEKDFEVLRVALNATDDEVKSNKTHSDGVASRVSTLESKYGSGVASAIQEYTWTPTEGQTVFTLPSGQTYAAGYIDVIVGGVLQTDVIESSGTTFTLAEGVPAGVTEVYAKWFQGVALASSLVPSITDMPGYSTNVDDRIGILLEDIRSITALGGKKDGSNDVSDLIADFASGRDKVGIFFPEGVYRWDNAKLLDDHESIVIIGHNAEIHHYQSGFALKIGNVNTKKTNFFKMQGIRAYNKKPKPVSNGTGDSFLWVQDAKTVILDDVESNDAEQYGIMLRADNGNIDECIISKTRVKNCGGTISTTTPIAIATRAEGTTGRIKRLRISDSYFHVSDSYTNDQGGTTIVSLSNAGKIQGVDDCKIVNTDFVNGKENGPLSILYDCKKVKMNNVNCYAETSASNALTISDCPNLELYIDNCELFKGVNQSMGFNGAIKYGKIANSKLEIMKTVSGTASNVRFYGCEFTFRVAFAVAAMTFFKFFNCEMSADSPSKIMVINATASDMKIVNFDGLAELEIAGDRIDVIGGEYTLINPVGNSSNCLLKNVKMYNPANSSLVVGASTVSNYTIEGCELIRDTGAAGGSIAVIRGSKMRFLRNNVIQKDKTVALQYAVNIRDSTDCVVLEKENYFDANVSSSLIGGTVNTNLQQYQIGDTFVNGGVPQIWNGTAFVNI